MIIRAHSVPILASGLSAMQERLLRSEKFVRLVSAPTGSGKSYAFMRAVLDEDKHVLFIVPTKRLLQDLIEDARDQAREQLRKRGWEDDRSRAWTHEQIIEWSGNQAPDGDESLTATRVRQFLSGGMLSAGRIIFAIPEVVVQMISGIRMVGASVVNPFLYLRRFDHIVFDEFHTIDDRSFGLACLFSLLAVTERQGKVSLLSATPIDVTTVLERTGVAPDDIEKINEKIVDGHPPGHRPIHGNVTVSLRECALPESVRLSLDEVRRAGAGGRAVIVIYDSLKDLKREEPAVRTLLHRIGIPDEKILTMSSIDDSEQKPGEPRRGRRYEDPRGYDVLLCTSLVEVGVNFRSTLMFMAPGHGLASFVQRVGRVSRGAENGQVIVSLSEQRRRRDAWTRRVAEVVESNDEMSVEAFTAQILRDVQQRMEPARKEAERTTEDGATMFYRRVSRRGPFWAALFIVAVRQTKMKVQKGAREQLRQISSPVVKFVAAKIREIEAVEVVNGNQRRQSQPHKLWLKALLASALTYRDIGATVTVIDPNGTRHSVREAFLHHATDLFSRHIVSEEDGERVIHLMSRTLNEEIRDFSGKQDVQRMTLYVPSPIGDGDFSLSILEREKKSEQLGIRLVEEWQHRFAKFIPAPGEHVQDPRKKVMGAATALVERLGRPPLEEDYENDSAESALFA